VRRLEQQQSGGRSQPPPPPLDSPTSTRRPPSPMPMTATTHAAAAAAVVALSPSPQPCAEAAQARLECTEALTGLATRVEALEVHLGARDPPSAHAQFGWDLSTGAGGDHGIEHHTN
jgi:hypothetical protein